MEEERDFWQRFGGHLLLVAVALIFILSRHINWASSAGDETEPAPMMPAPTATTAAPAEPLADPAAVAEAAVLPGNLPVNNLPVVHDTSLAPVPNPRTYQAKLPAHNFVTHEVKANETPNGIAEIYGISPETLLGGNPWLSQESNQLQAGAQLVILPVDGILHTVEPGETLESIAAQYSVTVDTIVSYEPNNLEFPYYRLTPDTQLLIPGVTIGQFYWTAPKTVAGGRGPGGTQQWTVIGTGVFTWPVSGRCITGWYTGFHPGLDVSMREGSAVYAADRGTVSYAGWASGTFYDYGNLIVVNHGNGFETLYAHLSSIGVYVGQTLEQGNVIGFSGNTGRSSGPHLHFEIRLNDFRENPLNRLGGAAQDCT